MIPNCRYLQRPDWTGPAGGAGWNRSDGSRPLRERSGWPDVSLELSGVAPCDLGASIHQNTAESRRPPESLQQIIVVKQQHFCVAPNGSSLRGFCFFRKPTNKALKVSGTRSFQSTWILTMLLNSWNAGRDWRTPRLGVRPGKYELSFAASWDM